MRTIMVAAALGVVLVQPAMAEKGKGFLDGNTLFDWCVKHSPAGTACTDYIAGVADALAYDGKFCPSVGVSPDQVVDVVTQYLTTFPERRHYAAASLVADALAAKFPCAQ
jgi:Ssp1 endopeptidase immunity protein Rap1a